MKITQHFLLLCVLLVTASCEKGGNVDEVSSSQEESEIGIVRLEVPRKSEKPATLEVVTLASQVGRTRNIMEVLEEIDVSKLNLIEVQRMEQRQSRPNDVPRRGDFHFEPWSSSPILGPAPIDSDSLDVTPL